MFEDRFHTLICATEINKFAFLCSCFSNFEFNLQVHKNWKLHHNHQLNWKMHLSISQKSIIWIQMKNFSSVSRIAMKTSTVKDLFRNFVNIYFFSLLVIQCNQWKKKKKNDRRHKTRYINKRRDAKKKKTTRQITTNQYFSFLSIFFSKVYENLHLTSRTHTVE